MTTTSRKPFGLPMVVGLILAIVGGLIAIGAAIYVSGSGIPLWALLLLAFGLNTIKRYHHVTNWEPALIGFLMCVMYLGIAGAAVYLETPLVLWAMILVGIVADKIVD